MSIESDTSSTAAAGDDDNKAVRFVAGGAPLSASPGAGVTASTDNDQTLAPDAEPRINSAATIVPGGGIEFGPADGLGGRPQLIGDYELLGELAHGGMGVVFRARQVSLNRPVALKMILAGRLAGRAALERFRLEATAVAQLEHRHIVPIYEVGQDGGQHFFSMRLLEGGSVADHLNRFVEDPMATAVLVEKVGRAIHYAHQRGILHRDLKPGNILLCSADEPHVSDFGLAKWSELDSGLTQSEACLGTPGFMAPEQVRGAKNITTSADVYSLGAILYQMLTGVPPFSGSSPAEVLRQVTDNEPPTPRTLRPKVPRDLETICLKCLRKEPHLRYASAEALADDLQRFRLGEPIEARTVGSAERLWSWCRRKPALAGAGAIAIFATFAALIILSFALIFLTREQRRTEQAFTRAMLENSQAKFAASDATRGMLALVGGLDRAISSGATDLEASLRQQLGVWRNFVHPLRCVVDQGELVNSVAINADATVIITGGHDQARVWDVATGQSIRSPLRHAGRIVTVALDTTSAHAITGSDDGTAVEWDLSDGRMVGAPMKHDGQVLAVAFSPDGKFVATAADDKKARIWDAATASLRQTLPHESAVKSVDFSIDGRFVITGEENGRVQLWDANTGKQRGLTVSSSDGKPIVAARIGIDGNIIAATSERARRWDAQTGKPIDDRDIVLPEGTAATSLCRTNLMIAGGDDNLARLWNLTDGQRLGPPIGHPSSVRAAAIAAGGKWLVTGCVDGTARVWGVATGQTRASPLRANGKIAALAVDPNGGAAITGDDAGSAIVWDLRASTPSAHVFPHDKAIKSVAYDPTGKVFLTGSKDGHARVWSSAPGNSNPSLLDHGTDAWVDVVAFSPAGDRAITGGNDKIARLWEPASQKPIGQPMVHDDAITAASFRRDGWNILTASRDGNARLWDAQTGKPIGEPMWHERGVVWAAAFSPAGGYLATVGDDRTARLWDDRTAEAIGSPLTHEDEVHALAFSSTGATMATGCQNGSVCLWDMTGVPKSPPRLLHRIKHNGGIAAIAFSPDGRLLLTGGTDNSARLWDVATGDAVGPALSHEGTVIAVAFDPATKLALTASEDGTLRLWPTSPAAESASDLKLWAETTTGMALDADGTTRWLSAAEWRERSRALHDRQGGTTSAAAK